MAFPELNSARLTLRKIELADQQNIYRGLSDPKVIEHYGVSFKTFEATAEQMLWYKQLEEKQTGIWWAVCLKDSNTFIGAGGINDINNNYFKAEVGFWLYPEHWGQGYMPEAMYLISTYAYDVLKLNRLEGFVDDDNEKCKKALQKLHYKLEGNFKEHEYENGRFVDLNLFAQLKTDFKAQGA
jgi:ribosomal-protein-alanine N-acetyltransferase